MSNASCFQYLDKCPDTLPYTGFPVWIILVVGVVLLSLGIWGLWKRADRAAEQDESDTL